MENFLTSHSRSLFPPRPGKPRESRPQKADGPAGCTSSRQATAHTTDGPRVKTVSSTHEWAPPPPPDTRCRVDLMRHSRTVAAGCPGPGRWVMRWWCITPGERPTEWTGPPDSAPQHTHTHTQSWMFPFSTASPLYFHPQLSSEFHTAFLDAPPFFFSSPHSTNSILFL